MATHDVRNQVPPLEDYDLLAADPVLVGAVAGSGAGWAADQLSELGRVAGSAETIRLGFLANRYEPELRTHDQYGHRIDEVEYHDAYHQLMALSIGHGLHSLPGERPAGEGGRVARDIGFSLVSQIEAGHGCPISMTTSAVPVLRQEPTLAETWLPAVLTRDYDRRLVPVTEKAGATLGMGMTEKQGGSDVRTNTTRAAPTDDGLYRLTGHKWFTSAPMSDGFLVLAQAPGGLTCFLLPRVLPDGTRNTFTIQRLKDKLGNRSNASAEVEHEGALAHRVGDEGRGVATIIEMVNNTRLDCVVGSVGQMRQAVHQAGWHARHRSAFGGRLIDKPLMQNVLADLEIEVEVATLLMLRLSAAFDRAELDPAEQGLRRIGTPVVKYWVSKRCTAVVREAVECLGGNGYVEESILPRLFRESPVNAIWEGSGNVIALDALRALARSAETAEALRVELEAARGADAVLDRAIDDLLGSLTELEGGEAGARILVERMAVLLGASVAVRQADPEVADAWISSRVAGRHGSLPGTLDPSLPLARLAARAVPEIA
jgi:putative acyl-CoA dehydrogenase